jgi:hypothetical protein
MLQMIRRGGVEGSGRARVLEFSRLNRFYLALGIAVNLALSRVNISEFPLSQAHRFEFNPLKFDTIKCS